MSRTSISSCLFVSSSWLSSTGATKLAAFDAFAVFFTTPGFLVVEALSDAVLIAKVLGAADLVDAFGATVFATEDFVVVTLADVEAFDAELFGGAFFGATALGAGFSAGSSFVFFDGAFFAAAALGASFGACSSSVFFGRPRRTGALRMLAFSGDSGGVTFAWARCARVRTIFFVGNGQEIKDVVGVGIGMIRY